MAGPVRIAFVADTAAAQRAVGGLGDRMKTGLRNVAIGAGVAAGAAVKFGVSAVQSASSAQQSLGATETVFGKYADTVVRRSNDAARAIGLSANEYRELSNSTGAMLASAGTPLQKVADLTGRLNQRGADMAATFGGTTREAVEAIGSLLRGETDPIERYGVSIRESDVSARLAAKGLDGLTGSALKQAQQQARLSLLFEQTGKTAGQFGREAGTLAGQQQRLGALFENLKAQLGTALLPIVTRVMTVLVAAIPTLQKWAGQLKTFLTPVADGIRAAFTALQTSLAPVINFLRANPAVIKGVAIALGVAAAAAGVFALAMGAVALAASPITLVVLAVAAVGGAIALAYQRSAAFRGVIATVVGALKQFGAYVLTTVLPAVRTLAGQVGERLRPILTAIGNVFRNQIIPAVTQVVAKFREASPVIGRAASIIGKIIGFALRLGAAIAGKVIPIVIRFGGAILGKLIPFLGDMVVNISRAIVTVYDFGVAFVNGVKKVIAFGIAVKNKVGEAVRFIGTVPGKIKSGLGDLGSLLLQAGKDVISGLINGIRDMASSAVDAAKDVVGGAVDGAKALLGINSPSKVFKAIGVDTIAGLVVGLRGGRSDTREVIKRVMGEIPKAARAGLEPLADKLRELGGRQDDVNKQYERGAERLKELTKAHADYVKQVAANVVSFGSLGSLGEGDGYGNVDQLLELRGDRVAAARRFAEMIKQLAARGLNKADLNDIISKGVDGGYGLAETLLSGGRSAISTANSLAAQLARIGKQLGTTGADSMYKAGMQSARGLLAGLRSQQRALDAIARRLGMRLYQAVKRALKINSPSKTFTDLGAQTADGLRVGLRRARIEREGARLASALREGFGTPALDSYLGGSGRGRQRGATTPTIIQLVFPETTQAERGGRYMADISAARAKGGRVMVRPA